MRCYPLLQKSGISSCRIPNKVANNFLLRRFDDANFGLIFDADKHSDSNR